MFTRLRNLRLTDFSPFGPIFGKELRITARRKRNHLLRVLYLGGLLLFLLMVWSASYYNRSYGGVAERIQQQNRLGQDFFVTFSFFCVISMGLIAPVLTSTAISSERLGKTLPVLLMTPITNWQIVSGKLLSRLLIALMLIGLSLPVLAVVRLLGGVEISQMIAVICICITFAMSSGAIGLFLSTLMNRSYAVILLSYAAMLFLYLFIPMMMALMIAGGRGPSTGWLQFMMVTNPVMTVALHSVPERPPPGLVPSWWGCAVLQLVMTLALLLSSAALLRWFARREGQRAAPAPIDPLPALPVEALSPQEALEVQVLEEEQATASSFTAGPSAVVLPPPPIVQYQTKRVHKTREVGDNPVLWRELRKPLMTMRWAWIGGVLVVGLLLLTYVAAANARALEDEETQCVYACAMHGLFWLLIAVLSATSIAQEKESDTWTVLLAAPLRAHSIVLGKLLGLSRRLVWPTILIIVHFCIFAIAGVINFPLVLLILWVLITFNSIWAALGVFLSLRFKKVTTAVIINLIVPVVVFIGVPVTLLIAGTLIARTDDWGEHVFWYLPYFYLGEGISRLAPEFSWDKGVYLPGSRGSTVPASEFIGTAIAIGLVHLGIAVLIVWRTISGFDRYVGRAQQLRPNLYAISTRPLVGSP
jgi:ABC-type transport system involved in multi-copper enzyme maturation permease subunit